MKKISDIKTNNNPSEELKAECEGWPVWQSPAREFDWFYTETEMALIIEGEVEIISLDGKESVKLEAGDYAEFPEGLECRWNVTKDLKKHYNFK
ncbi:hypothetical protein L21SP3_00083 [Sedimentisphaera cyanobacteriorum]|uniref:(S)-ureidoglycine aminohydrolase cupin domain-containing protein n=1 Tax=Sedimentisphaera cyanobacteriorum TaxID=1940790 RepID=A0A1Q2HLG3_9BACT|nr:cupin domain-containing protein [Sedimentisphaera cyanobacteriorum]AQQ08307.1 hypothetical protein L21SP3_00083 [Sedimentisphaera cyanobacteriorum]